MKKKTVVSVTVVAMLFAISLYFVGGTYARYVSEFTGEGQVAIAKWSVKLADGNEGKEMTLDLTAAPSEDVVDGKIAPSVGATGTAEITLAGTEVAVDVFAEVDEAAITKAINEALGDGSVEESDITATVKVEADEGATDLQDKISGNGSQAEPYVIKLPDSGAGFTESDKLKLTVEVKWENDDTHSLDHTKIGEKAESLAELKIPVKLYVVQHLTETFDPKSISTP